MEVHTHTHPALGGTRKKWTHYFWEFLMLFLAVFCGFLAENIREHAIEHQREKQYARTLYEDIKSDTAALAASIDECEFVTSRIDSFRRMVQMHDLGAYPTGTWYYYGRFGTRTFSIAFQDATIEQLKSSGGLRYFRKQNVVNAIAHYDQGRREFLEQLHQQDLTYNDIIKTRNQVFNAFYFDEIMRLDISGGKIDSFKQEKMPFLSNRKEDLLQYANLCQLRSYNNKGIMEIAVYLLKNAGDLLVELKKEYHLK
jgi:hypothetical protein